jgi:hypothetical protein
MYQITYQLPESKHIKSTLLNMDGQQRELYEIIQKKFRVLQSEKQVGRLNTKLLDTRLRYSELVELTRNDFQLFSRSLIASTHQIPVAEGVVNTGYGGEIFIFLSDSFREGSFFAGVRIFLTSSHDFFKNDN